MTRGTRLSQVAAAVCSLAVLPGCLGPELAARPPDTVRVTHISDGDTFTAVDDAGQRIRVRLLGIDAPETAHDGHPAACGGDAASASLEDLLLGHDVDLVNDPRADTTDRYGRRLAYVDVDGVDAALHQLQRGYAEAWYPRSEPQPARYPSYRQAQNTARDAHDGAWATCSALGR